MAGNAPPSTTLEIIGSAPGKPKRTMVGGRTGYAIDVLSDWKDTLNDTRFVGSIELHFGSNGELTIKPKLTVEMPPTT